MDHIVILFTRIIYKNTFLLHQSSSILFLFSQPSRSKLSWKHEGIVADPRGLGNPPAYIVEREKTVQEERTGRKNEEERRRGGGEKRERIREKR